nr:ABC transporter substrate-binding protein [Streptomyces sp. Ag109_O5-1]
MVSLGAAALLTLTGRTSSKDGSTAASGTSLTIGTTDQVTSLDPAGAWDAGSGTIESEVYSTLLSVKNGSAEPTPDLATAIKLTGPKQYTVTLKKGLKFANGHELTSSDVKFSFDRELRIADQNGPSSLLYNLGSVAASNPTTVVFTLKSANAGAPEAAPRGSTGTARSCTPTCPGCGPAGSAPSSGREAELRAAQPLRPAAR